MSMKLLERLYEELPDDDAIEYTIDLNKGHIFGEWFKIVETYDGGGFHLSLEYPDDEKDTPFSDGETYNSFMGTADDIQKAAKLFHRRIKDHRLKVVSRAPKNQDESPSAFSVSQEALDYSIGRGLLTSRTDEWIRLEIDVTPQELVRIINFLWEMNK